MVKTGLHDDYRNQSFVSLWDTHALDLNTFDTRRFLFPDI